jgi:hypothetical protein
VKHFISVNVLKVYNFGGKAATISQFFTIRGAYPSSPSKLIKVKINVPPGTVRPHLAQIF